MTQPDTQVPVSENFEKNIDYLLKELRIEINFDIIYRNLKHANKNLGLFFVDAFAKDDIAQHILRELEHINSYEIRKNTVEKLVQTFIPHIEVETTEDLEDVIIQTLSGQAALIVEGCKEAIIIDIREYPARSPEEPDIERVVRGPRDGFVETLVFNAELIRRRLRDRSLIMEYMQIGQRSKTDMVISYVDSIVDPELVKRIKKALKNINIDGIVMGEKTLEEFIFGRSINPYPLVRYTERADTSATHLTEGHLLLIVDGSPSVMICPTTFWHHLQHAEEYRQKPVVGAFLRWIRFIAVFASLFLLPLWFVFSSNPDLLPETLDFIGPEEVGEVPLFLQILLAEIGIEILRMAAIHTPSALATALGLVAAILIGEIAVEVGLFTSEVILYIAIAAMSNYAMPSYELGLANRIFRIVFLVFGALGGLYGFLGGVILWFLVLAFTKSLNTPYLWPLVPFNFKALLDVIIRMPIPLKKTRPSVLNTQDNVRDK